jgi:hypothetical protein
MMSWGAIRSRTGTSASGRVGWWSGMPVSFRYDFPLKVKVGATSSNIVRNPHRPPLNFVHLLNSLCEAFRKQKRQSWVQRTLGSRTRIAQGKRGACPRLLWSMSLLMSEMESEVAPRCPSSRHESV